jgi:hypothetical protein
MPKYTVRNGHKLVVTDPDQPGQTLDKLGGSTVELTEDEAAQYPGALDLVVEATTAATANTQDVVDAIKGATTSDLHQPAE